MNKFSLLITLLLGICISGYAQELKHKPRKSPTGLTTFKEDSTYIKVTYGRPKMRTDYDHKFGVSVPYGKLWRMGDDDATEMTVTQPITFGGEKLEPGIYSIFAIPEEEKWTVIVNKDVGMWGSYKYDKEQDLFRVERPVLKSPYVFQEFSIFLQEAEFGCNMVIIWDRTSIMIPIEIN
ncbi:DUF2911 domain-containing protein [Limibacter armeniacum]|uniref:DUF2911 domain-containing protein n=1 Tax=Limibacter armeniacum TaxID=466084 RepID=UPI002FE61896